ncbi:hypothetical protein GCM10007108_14140 [Thermogymnomonas acidicola]|uniref:Macrocin O-methyltransferase n=1 Tax=Thermogymnomonas acidicola TaxID=399579 RepID=A0AA37BS47_9ARCH|nr:TylF/MycF/NovP-related O-methyltransferase [Thermogymnomonas acidicola]GGM77184.1 hypothetical protein GCM10007108_14140 [Thermogymnomonas acidicola]
MSIYQSIQRISPILWWKHSFTIENLNLNPLLKKFFDENKNCPSFNDRHEHFKYINDKVIKEDPIDYLEFGVYKGDSIREWSSLNKNPVSRFYGFDSFEGLPEDWTYTMRRGEFNLNGNIPHIDDSRVKMVKGLFQNTLRPFLKSFRRIQRIVVHLDADLFSSTLYVLTSLDPFLEKGDVLMFDEFSAPTGEFKAFIDYKTAFYREFKMVSKVPFNGWLANQVAFLIEK